MKVLSSLKTLLEKHAKQQQEKLAESTDDATAEEPNGNLMYMSACMVGLLLLLLLLSI